MLLRKNSVKSGLEEQSFLHSSIIIVRFQKKLRVLEKIFSMRWEDGYIIILVEWNYALFFGDRE
jgi:hypothetical protein